MSHQVTNDQKPAVADRNGDFAPIDSSDPIFWATEHGAKKTSRLAPCRQVGDTPSLLRNDGQARDGWRL